VKGLRKGTHCCVKKKKDKRGNQCRGIQGGGGTQVKDMEKLVRVPKWGHSKGTIERPMGNFQEKVKNVKKINT